MSPTTFIRTALCVFVCCVAAPAAHAGIYSSPAPTVTVTPTSTVLRMELNAYKNYGTVDMASDILYTGDAHAWSFGLLAALPAYVSRPACSDTFLTNNSG